VSPTDINRFLGEEKAWCTYKRELGNKKVIEREKLMKKKKGHLVKLDVVNLRGQKDLSTAQIPPDH